MFQLGPEHHGEVRVRGRGGGQRQHLLHRQPLAHRRQEGEPRLQQGQSCSELSVVIKTLMIQDFLCTCDRCQDETENETYMSAIKCTKCAGFFLPEKPLGGLS